MTDTLERTPRIGRCVDLGGDMDWFYFRRDGNRLILVEDPSPRTPPGSSRKLKNESFDDHHVHVKGVDAEDARMRALSMIFVGE